MKTYSVATQNEKGDWITNWHQYQALDDINFDNVCAFCIENKCKAYGYYYEHNSRNLTSARSRTVLETII